MRKPKEDKVYLTAYIEKEFEDKIYELKMRPEYVRMNKSQVCSELLRKGMEQVRKELGIA